MLQGAELRQNVREGVIMGNRSLVLQSLDTDNTGLYSCQAANTVGKGMSNVVNLDIKCKWPKDLSFLYVSFLFQVLFVPKKLTLWLIHYFLLLVGGKSPPTDWSEKIFCHSFIISWAENNLKKNNAMVVDQVDLVDHMITLQLVRINEEWQQMITLRVIDI